MALEQLDQIESALGARYAIRRELGRGRVATVYLADDLKLQRAVAIKFVRWEVAAAIDVQRFLREIAIAAKLRHPHILPLLDSGEVEGNPFYVMPFVEGGSLRDVLSRQGALRVDDILSITREVAGALDYAHSQGVVHRDIKPENILFDQGHAVLADFGIARAIGDDGDNRLTKAGVAIGTPAYMSPEQAGADSLVDARSDVYALGCVVYEMLAGEPPFSGATAQAVIARHFHERIPSLRVVRPTTAPATQRVLETAMAKVPADRYSTASDMAKALASSMRGRTSLGRRVTLGAVAVAVIVLAAIVGQRARSERGAAAARAATALDQRRLAILYFEDASPGKSLSHIAAGLTEDLIDRLSQVRALSVVSPNGVRPFIGKTPPIDSMARALKVGTIVSGSVTRAGRALRLNVRLIDGSTGRQVDNWIVDQSADDDLTLQERLVSKLTVYLREHIDQAIVANARRSETKSVIAWETLMQADDLLRRANAAIREQRGQVAVELLQGADSLDVRAARLDPAWIAPIVHRGRVAFTRSYVNSDRASTDQPPAYWLRRAIMFADDALRLDAHSPDALALRGDGRWRLVIQTNDDSLLPLAETDLQQALEARPDLARAWRTLSDLYYLESRFAEAETAARKALDADAFLPNLASVLSTLFSASLESERFDEAASWCHRGLQEYPRDRQLMDCDLTLLGSSARGGDQVAAAWHLVAVTEGPDSLRAMEITWGYRRTLVAAVLARTGMRDSARAVLRRMRAQAANHPRSVDVPLNEAYVYALLDDRDEAIRLLTRGVRSDLDRTYILRTARYRPLHDDPRFQALTKSSKSS